MWKTFDRLDYVLQSYAQRKRERPYHCPSSVFLLEDPTTITNKKKIEPMINVPNKITFK